MGKIEFLGHGDGVNEKTFQVYQYVIKEYICVFAEDNIVATGDTQQQAIDRATRLMRQKRQTQAGSSSPLRKAA